MKQKIMMLFLAILMCFTFTLSVVNVQGATTLTSNATGTIDGYNYELWKDSGTTSMTLNGGGKFSCSWSNINNALFRIGKKFDSTQTHQQLGNIKVDYGCNYSPNGNSYLCVYGWTRSPLVEYYIVDSWGSWRPPGATSKGTITIDGGTYDVYETTRTNQPSIDGNATFQQYWSVRTSKRTSGTISVTQHFNAWANKGMTLGKMYEVALTVEGYQSSGSADVTSNTITIGGSSNPTPTPTPTSTSAPTPTPGLQSAFSQIEAESFTTQSGIQSESCGEGGQNIGYIENGDYAVYNNIDFGSGATSFQARVASNTSGGNIEIRLDSITGTLIGTCSVAGTGGWQTWTTSTCSVIGASGTHDVYLKFTGGSGYLFNLNWFKFVSGTVNPTPTPTPVNVTPPPATPTPVPGNGSLTVQFYNQSTAATSNSIYLNIKLVNTGSSAIALSDVKVRYFYTIDDTKTQNFYCDYSPLGSANVNGTFVTMATAKTGADTYVEIGFTSGAGNLAAGASTTVQARFAKSDWTNYTQTNDYSFNSSSTTFVDWTKVTAYISGSLQWGTEP